MMRKPSSVRFVTGALLVAVLAATFAPAAEAGSRNKQRRYKGGHHREARVVRHSHGHGSHGSTYIVRHSNAGPVIAGFLGGLFLGATIANAAPAGYTYYDPYCEEHFGSLEIYRSHFRHHRHPRVVRVIEVESGDCTRSYRYSDGKWRDWGDRDSGYRDDGYDRREWERDDDRRDWNSDDD